MASIKKLYEAMQTFRESGISISDEQERQICALEEEIIKKEILPVVKQAIEPALKEIQREIVLVVDYKPGEPISVSLSRKTNVNKLISATPIIVTPNPVEPAKTTVVSRSNHVSQLKPRTFANATDILRKFVKYMRDNTHKESTVNGYINALTNHVPNYTTKIFKNGERRSLFCYTDVDEVRSIFEKLQRDIDFQVDNEDMHYEMSAAIRKYINFLKENRV